MKVVKSNTVLGRRLLDIGSKYEGTFLRQVYNKCSREKELAWDKYFEEYCNTDGAEMFGICSHNNFNFSVSWFTPDGMRLETPKNSYLIV